MEIASVSGPALAGLLVAAAGSRTVYILQGNRPQPVEIKTGISDGVMTEVTDGLKEGERVVTAQLSGPTTANAPQPGNPFGGPRRL